MANVDLLKKIRKVINEQPERWNQHVWAAKKEGQPDPEVVQHEDGTVELVNGSCGTSLCIAGWACFLSGYKLDWEDTEPGDRGAVIATFVEDGREIEAVAREVLDIDVWDSSTLFYGMDTELTKARLDELIENGYLAENAPYHGHASGEF